MKLYPETIRSVNDGITSQLPGREVGWEMTRVGRFEFSLKSCSRKVCMLLRKKGSELPKTSVSYISPF